MGYTHYWYRTPELEPAAYARWRHDVQQLHEALPATTTSGGGHYKDKRLSIHGPDGRGEPVFAENLIAFNGRCGGRSSLDDLGHETFYVPRELVPAAYQDADELGRYFDFCKTARKPYDLLVTAALIALSHHFPDHSGSEPDTLSNTPLPGVILPGAKLPGAGVKVLSDGEPSDWEQGLELTRRVLGYGELPFRALRAR